MEAIPGVGETRRMNPPSSSGEGTEVHLFGHLVGDATGTETGEDTVHDLVLFHRVVQHLPHLLSDEAQGRSTEHGHPQQRVHYSGHVVVLKGSKQIF